MSSVEEFEFVTEDAEDRVPGEAGPRRRTSPFAPWVATSVALMLVGAATATPFAMPGLDYGLLELDLTATPTVVWESAVMADPGLVDTVDDRAVFLTHVGGIPTYLAIDLADGTEVWRYADEERTCQRALPLVCVRDRGSLNAQVVTVDLADGGRDSRAQPAAIVAAAAGDSLVVVVKTETVYEDVVLFEPDGTERWRVPVDVVATQIRPVWVPIRVSETGAPTVAVGVGTSPFEPVDGDLVPPLDIPAVTLDLGTGEQRPSGASYRDQGFVFDYLDGEIVITGPEGRVTVSDTEPVTHDDDLGGPVRVEDTGTVVDVSMRATEEELWRGSPECFLGARLRGFLVMYCYDGPTEVLVGVDELTGERLWEVPWLSWVLAASADTLVVTDSYGVAVLGVDPRTGATLWSVPVSGGAFESRSAAIDGGVLLMIGSRVVRLAWD